jgi:hypothetical protein
MPISINIIACLECSCHIWVLQLVYFDKIHHDTKKKFLFTFPFFSLFPSAQSDSFHGHIWFGWYDAKASSIPGLLSKTKPTTAGMPEYESTLLALNDFLRKECPKIFCNKHLKTYYFNVLFYCLSYMKKLTKLNTEHKGGTIQED